MQANLHDPYYYTKGLLPLCDYMIPLRLACEFKGTIRHAYVVLCTHMHIFCAYTSVSMLVKLLNRSAHARTALRVVFCTCTVASFAVPETSKSYTAANRQVRMYARPKGWVWYIVLTNQIACYHVVEN